MINSETIRRGYQPEKVRILLVGESPPAGGTFFYAANSNLYRYTKLAFSQALGWEFAGKEFLTFLKKTDVYLEDLCLTPVNYKDKLERKRLRKEGVAPLSERIREHDPEVIICVMKGIDPEVREAVRLAGMEDRDYYCVPFPANGNQKRFVDEMVPIVKSVVGKGQTAVGN